MIEGGYLDTHLFTHKDPLANQHLMRTCSSDQVLQVISICLQICLAFCTFSDQEHVFSMPTLALFFHIFVAKVKVLTHISLAVANSNGLQLCMYFYLKLESSSLVPNEFQLHTIIILLIYNIRVYR